MQFLFIQSSNIMNLFIIHPIVISGEFIIGWFCITYCNNGWIIIAYYNLGWHIMHPIQIECNNISSNFLMEWINISSDHVLDEMLLIWSVLDGFLAYA